MKRQFLSAILTLCVILAVCVGCQKEPINDDNDELQSIMVPEGAIGGLFSINIHDKVLLSKGNLQYQASTDTWRFAEHQWDFVGSLITEDNEQSGTVSGSSNHLISPTYDGWIDLFGWGTSNFNHHAVCYQPWSTSTNNSDYFAYCTPEYNMYDSNGKADWGHNAISNGGNQENQWRTLTRNEWLHLIYWRRTSSGRTHVLGQVNGVNGFILIPDTCKAETVNLLTFSSFDFIPTFASNTIDADTWTHVFEAEGFAFLPAAGYRDGLTFNYIGYNGHYWTSSTLEENAFSILLLETGGSAAGSDQRHRGYSVRLARDYE